MSYVVAILVILMVSVLLNLHRIWVAMEYINEPTGGKKRNTRERRAWLEYQLDRRYQPPGRDLKLTSV